MADGQLEMWARSQWPQQTLLAAEPLQMAVHQLAAVVQLMPWPYCLPFPLAGPALLKPVHESLSTTRPSALIETYLVDCLAPDVHWISM